MDPHPIHLLLEKGREASNEESLLATAVVLLSTQPRYARMSVDQVYDEVVKHRNVLHPPQPPPPEPQF
jgi:hypothetical protein